MYVATAYPIIGNYVAARTKAAFKGPQRATQEQATADTIAYDMLNLAQLNTDNYGAGIAWFVEVVDGSEGGEDPVSRTVDGRAVQLTS